jgi:hypothetical protein
LIDENIAFSTRTTTLERIAVVMGIEPESFPEYKRPEEPRLIDPGVEFLKSVQRDQGLSNVQFLKRFARNQRLEIVDMWRGSLPMPLDWAKLSSIAGVLELRTGAEPGRDLSVLASAFSAIFNRRRHRSDVQHWFAQRPVSRRQSLPARLIQKSVLTQQKPALMANAGFSFLI